MARASLRQRIGRLIAGSGADAVQSAVESRSASIRAIHEALQDEGLMAEALAMARAAASSPIDQAPIEARFFGLTNQSQDKARLLRQSIGVFDMSARAVAGRLSGLNPQVAVNRRVADGTLATEVLDDHRLKFLIDNPHPNFTRRLLFRLSTLWIMTVGEAYWLKVGDGFGLATELHPLRPDRCEPLVEGGVISGYEVYGADGARHVLDPDLVVYTFLPDMVGMYSGRGVLAPSGITADGLNFANLHLREHYQNDATPKTVLEPQEGAEPFKPEEERSWRKSFINRFQRHKGVDRQGPAVIPTHYKLIQLALQSGADVVPLLEHWRDEQLMNTATPRSTLGQVTSGDRSSAEVSDYTFDKHAVLPYAEIFEDSMTAQLARDFDPALLVIYEEFLADDKEFQLKQEDQDLKNKVRSPNEVRVERGGDPAPWGDRPVATLADQPYMPELFDAEDPLDDDEGEPVDDEGDATDEPTGEAPRGLRVRRIGRGGSGEVATRPSPRGSTPRSASSRPGYFSKRAEWNRQFRREKEYIPAFVRELRVVFKMQRDAAIKAIEELGRTPVSGTVVRADIPADAVFDTSKWGRVFRRRVEPIRERLFASVVEDTLTGLGFTTFELTDEMRRVLRLQGARMIRQVNATTKRQIAAQLEQAAAAGESIGQIATRIRSVFGMADKARARSIGRTEMLRASQQAQTESFKSSGVVPRKQWNTSLDADVRDSHEIDGQQVEVDGSFTLGDGERADAPGVGAGGSSLSAGNSVNCRCFVTPVLEES